jgi:hypothetical protein
VFGILGLLANVSEAQRPVAPKLLPDTTIAYLRVADTPQLIARFRETALGRIGQDEQVKPLVSQLYSTLQTAWGKIEEQVGVPLDQLLKIPQGEICVAYIGSKEGPTGVVALVDVKEQMYVVKKILEKGEEALDASGGKKETEQIDGQEVHAYIDRDGFTTYQFEKEGTFVATTNKELIKPLLASWTGGSEAMHLSDNDKFNSIMSRCQGAVDDPPQVTWYVDLIENLRTGARGNSGAQTWLALLPVMGLDGFKGFGGSMTFATGEFDSVSHMHIALESPRSGVLDMVAFGAGSVEPEQWVPADVASYATVHWNLQHTYDRGAVLYNSLMGEGEFQKEAQTRLGIPLGVEFEKDILPALDGRVTMCQWIDKTLPPRLNGQATILAAKLKDVEAFRSVFDKIVEKFSDQLEKKTFAGNSFYVSIPPENQPPPPPAGNPPENAPRRRPSAPPEICIALLGDYFVFTNQSGALRKMILTASEPGTSLASELDFKLIASKIKRQNGGDAPAMLQFSRPEEGMRYLYELAGASDTQRRLARQAERNDFFHGVEQAMKDNPLPPFSVLAKYLAPGGGMITSDETGIHYSTFTLRRK